jgi:photosynthetic reaction center H subunit
MTTGTIDFALVAIIAFFMFFTGLVIYLRREDRREGYPLEEDGSGRVRSAGGLLFAAQPKTFRLAGGAGTYTAPNANRDRRELSAKRTSRAPGSPLQPVGDPMLAGVGPGSYAERSKTPDMTAHGTPVIQPMRAAVGFSVVKGDGDPRGMTVKGTDGKPAGTVSDLWVDVSESMIRYLEVTLTGSGKAVLLPITVSMIDKGRKVVRVDAITGAQFENVPVTSSQSQVTLDEEERITAYYGGGFLYATPSRTEPLL